MSLIVSSLARQTYEAVRRRILMGDIPPNAPVRQDLIAEELGVSTIPLREALSRLEQDGLLSSYPNRGYVVRPLSAAEASEVFSLRLKLEPSAVAEGALKAGPEDQRQAEQELARLEQTETGEGANDPVTANRLFHLALIRPGAGLVTLQLLERLHVLAERYVRVHLQPSGRQARAKEEHRALLQTWLAKDAPEVEALTADHLRATIGDLQAELSA
jgi:DNA-binding GntR family transcriptional regulator